MDRVEVGLSESPVAPAYDTNTRSGGSFRYLRFLPRGIPGLMEHLGRGPVAHGLRGPQANVEQEVSTQIPSAPDGIDVGFQVDLLILHGAPQPLHEDVVGVQSFSAHGDLYAAV